MTDAEREALFRDRTPATRGDVHRLMAATGEALARARNDLVDEMQPVIDGLRARIAELQAASVGPPGRSMEVRGTWDAAATYGRLDVVALNGASFVARRDDPGPCPGDGWQLVAGQGGRGKPGGTVTKAEVSDAGVLSLVNADGSRVTVDLAPVVAGLGRRK